MNSAYRIGDRLLVALDGGEIGARLLSIGPSGHRVHLDDGRTRVVAWWRLRRAA